MLKGAFLLCDVLLRNLAQVIAASLADISCYRPLGRTI